MKETKEEGQKSSQGTWQYDCPKKKLFVAMVKKKNQDTKRRIKTPSNVHSSRSVKQSYLNKTSSSAM